MSTVAVPQSPALPDASALTAELSAAHAALAQAQQDWQDLVYAVAHDLRAPLRHIQAYVQVIDEDFPGLPTELQQHLGTISQSAQLLTCQLDALTQLSRLAQLPLHPERLDVAALVQDAIAQLQADPRWGSAALAVRWQVDVPLGAVWADAAAMQQVLAELLLNTLKATLALPQAEPQVSVRCTADGALQIEDNGVGFRPAQASTLFKVFGKLHPVRQFEGLGCGLVRVRKLLNRMGAQIDMLPRSDGGCQVTLRFSGSVTAGSSL